MLHVEKIRILIADDHPVFRDGLAALLGTEPAFDVVGQAGDARTAAMLARALAPDILLLDVAMPRASGLTTLRELLRTPAGRTRAVIVTAAIDPGDVMAALVLGARGFVLKDRGSIVLFDAIRAVMRGDLWAGDRAVASLGEAMHLLGAAAGPETTAGYDLTNRQLDIVRLIVAGMSNQEIARRLAITEHRVKNALLEIFDKLGVSTRVELALFALDRHLPLGDRPLEARPRGNGPARR